MREQLDIRDRYRDDPELRAILRRESFDDIADLDRLEAIEDALREREDEIPPYELKRRLFRLYRRMWEVDPAEDKSRYVYSISRLLLEMGTDLKSKRTSLNEARKYFRELIRWKSPAPVPIAHYRLGFIAYTEQHWDLVIEHLERALRSMRDGTHPIESWAGLSRSQQLRAHVALANAHEHKRKEAAMQVRKLYGDGAGMDDTDRFWLEQLAGSEEEEDSYICVGGPAGEGKIRHIGEKEFRQLRRQEDAIVLDCTEPGQGRLWVGGVDCRIAGRNLALLKCLAGSPRPVSDRELEGKLGLRQPAVYIWRLRQFLNDHTALTGDKIIENIRPNRLNRGLSKFPDGKDDGIEHDRGYRWTCPNTFIVYRKDDPEYLFGPV